MIHQISMLFNMVVNTTVSDTAPALALVEVHQVLAVMRLAKDQAWMHNNLEAVQAKELDSQVMVVLQE